MKTLLLAIAFVASFFVYYTIASAGGSSRSDTTNSFEEQYADHFLSLDDIDAILVNYVYDESFFSRIDKQEALELAVETVKEQLPPELRDRVAPIREDVTYTGLNVHLDFYILSAQFKEHSFRDMKYTALATTALISYEAIDGVTVHRSLEKRAEYRLRTLKDPITFDENDRAHQMTGRLEEYTKRLNECLTSKGYEACIINDLGYFDINKLRMVAIKPPPPPLSKK